VDRAVTTAKAVIPTIITVDMVMLVISNLTRPVQICTAPRKSAKDNTGIAQITFSTSKPVRLGLATDNKTTTAVVRSSSIPKGKWFTANKRYQLPLVHGSWDWCWVRTQARTVLAFGFWITSLTLRRVSSTLVGLSLLDRFSRSVPN
jgi:hypothetical protein